MGIMDVIHLKGHQFDLNERIGGRIPLEEQKKQDQETRKLHHFSRLWERVYREDQAKKRDEPPEVPDVANTRIKQQKAVYVPNPQHHSHVTHHKPVPTHLPVTTKKLD